MNMKRRTPKRRSIVQKSELSHLLVVVITAVIFVSLSWFHMSFQLQDYHMNKTVTQAEDIAVRESLHEWHYDSATAQRIDAYQRLVGGTIIVADNISGKLSFYMVHVEQMQKNYVPLDRESARFRSERFDDERLSQGVRRVLEGETVKGARFFDYSQRWVVYTGVPVREPGGGVRCALFVVRPVQFMISSWMKLLLVLLLSFIGAVFFGVLLGARHARRLVKPVQDLTAEINTMMAERYPPLRIAPGSDEIEQLQGAFHELSDHVNRAMTSVYAERDRLNTIIDSLDDGILAVNSSMEVAHYNLAFLGDLDIKDFAELKVEAARKEDASLVFRTVRHTVETGETSTCQWTNGQGRTLYCRVLPVDSDVKSIGAVALLVDISEMERLEQLRREYIANISHELRTPLTGIQGLVEPLIDGVVDSEEERMQHYRIILREALRLEKLVGEMLELSRLQSGSVHLPQEPVAAGPLLRTAQERMSAQAEAAGVKIEVTAPEGELTALGDRARMLQVLIILLDNAIDFSPEGSTVTLSAVQTGNRVEFSVTDRGCGIQPKDLPYIWERFYKSDRSRMQTKGSGLGLAIARNVITLMDGEIDVESHPGKGSRFFFRLPKA